MDLATGVKPSLLAPADGATGVTAAGGAAAAVLSLPPPQADRLTVPNTAVPALPNAALNTPRRLMRVSMMSLSDGLLLVLQMSS